MIKLAFHPLHNPEKVALFLEEVGLPFETVPVDTSKGEQHLPAFRKINPNGKVPAIVDTDGPGGREARIFDSSAILLYLADKTGKFLGSPDDRPELLSWLFFIASGLGPFSGQAVHFQFAAPEGLDYLHDRRYLYLGLDRPCVPRLERRKRSARRIPEHQAMVRNDRGARRSCAGSGCRH